ncbi:MAG: isochorismate synthase [Bacteroidota bacterium]
MILEEILLKLENAYEQEMPFVVYRKPNDNIIKALFQNNDNLIFLEDYTQSGFVFAPFNNKDKTVLLPFDHCESFEFKIAGKQINILEKDNIKDQIDLSIKSHSDKQKHIELVEKGINFIKKGRALKVVLSRKEEVVLQNPDIGKMFKELIYKYISTFVYVWFHPKVGLWIGASPESLLKVNDKQFETMALAGTQIYKENTNVIWGEKELQEQQFVTDFLISKLNKKDLKIGKPFTLKAGNLLHICTKIEGKISDDINLEDLIQSLHPTPAVCGLPKEAAKDYILKNEEYEREFYAGFLGELNVNYNSDLFVNLRCMKIKDKIATLYIGGGITADSIPDNEWEETVAKSIIMKKVILV